MPTSRPIFWHTITYSSPGTKPPVYIAGSFTEPPWVARSMDYTQRPDGEFVFTQQVHIAPGREYQFKFRKGDIDWVLDENSAVVTDTMGNQNNTLCVEHKAQTKPHKHVPSKVLNELGIVSVDDLRSHTPVEQVANTAAEVADTAQQLDKEDIESSDADDGQGEYSWKKQEPIKTPLFAHESFGAYEFVDDGFDHAELGEPASSLSQSRSVSKDFALEEVDINDPTIEKFPSERGSVMDTLRKIQSSSSQDNIQIDNSPFSPSIGSRKSSVDSTADESTGTLSPSSPTSSKKRENRLSHSSFQKTRSAVSLGSIAEEPKAGETGAGDATKPRGPIFDAPVTPPSEEDDGVVMRDSKVTFLKESATAEASNPSRSPTPSTREQLSEYSIGLEKPQPEQETEPITPDSEDFWLDDPLPSRRYSREKGSLLSKCDADCIAPDQMDNPRTHAVPGNDRAALTTIGFITVAVGIAWWKGSRLLFR